MPRPIRSQSYQHIFNEVTIDWTKCPEPSLDDGLYTAPRSEAILEVQDQLTKLLIKLALAKLTPYQTNVLRMVHDGYTQTEIANVLNCRQSNIHKAIHGNTSYKDKYVGKSFGGIERKIAGIAKDSENYRALCQKLYDLDEGDRLVRLTASWFDNYQKFLVWLELTPKLKKEYLESQFAKIDPNSELHEELYRIADHLEMYHAQIIKQYRDWRRAHPPVRTTACQQCGVTLTSTGKAQYCSTCRKARAAARAREQRNKKKIAETATTLALDYDQLDSGGGAGE